MPNRHRFSKVPSEVPAGTSIQGSPRHPFGIAWVFGFMATAVGLGILLFAAPKVTGEERFAAIVTGGAFLGIGVLILAGGAHVAQMQRKFGTSRLQIDSTPRVAGTFSAQLIITSGLTLHDVVQLRLECRRLTRMPSSRSGETTQDHIESLWVGEKRVPLSSAPRGEIVLPIRFEIPPNLPPSFKGSPAIEWKVIATARLPGLDFREEFTFDVLPARTSATEVAPIDSPAPALPVNQSVAPGLNADPFSPETFAVYRVEADRRTGHFWPGWPGIGWLPYFTSGLLSDLPPWPTALRWVSPILAISAGIIFGSSWIPFFGIELAHWGLDRYSRLIRVFPYCIFSLATLWIVALALRIWHKHRHFDKFGISFLRLHSWPGILAGTLQGEIEIPRKLTPAEGFDFRLLCGRTCWSQSWVPGPAYGIDWIGRWASFIGFETDEGGTLVPFELPIPAKAPESGATEGSSQWYLEVRAKLPGFNYISRFIIPIRRQSPVANVSTERR